MVQSIGCAGRLALIGFIIACPFAFFIEARHWQEYLIPPCMTATFTFVAALLLFARDFAKRNGALQEVQHRLNSRSPMDDERFLAEPIACSDETIRMTRDAISEFFEVPVRCIYRNDSLNDIYNVSDFEPEFYFFTFDFVINKQLGRSYQYQINTEGLELIEDLALAINRQIIRIKHR